MCVCLTCLGWVGLMAFCRLGDMQRMAGRWIRGSQHASGVLV